MELDNLVTQNNAEAGVWTQVELYGKKQDFELNILGNDSDAVQKFNREQVKKMRRNAGKEPDDETMDALLETSDEAVLVRIAGIRGLTFDKEHKEITGQESVTLEGTALQNDQKSYRLLVKKIPAVKDFVLKISGDRANFLGGPSKI
ncbi:MAG: hypothetical protein LBK63_12695 [Treponema sp.]|jgi:hypothetical protein|nr:hypothetical protein [Treponema sp.]